MNPFFEGNFGNSENPEGWEHADIAQRNVTVGGEVKDIVSGKGTAADPYVDGVGNRWIVVKTAIKGDCSWAPYDIANPPHCSGDTFLEKVRIAGGYARNGTAPD